jgi:hypothetical protein
MRLRVGADLEPGGTAVSFARAVAPLVGDLLDQDQAAPAFGVAAADGGHGVPAVVSDFDEGVKGPPQTVMVTLPPVSRDRLCRTLLLTSSLAGRTASAAHGCPSPSVIPTSLGPCQHVPAARGQPA